MTNPVPTLLYIRQSLTREGSESIPTQIDVCTDAAPRLGAVIVDTLVERPSTSGYKDRGRSRPKFKAFEKAGCDIGHAVLTPNGWLSEFELGIRATTDREESRKTSDRMRDVRAREARAGKPRVSGRPFGYSCAGVRSDGCAVAGLPARRNYERDPDGGGHNPRGGRARAAR